jgi:hypothetical protein
MWKCEYCETNNRKDRCVECGASNKAKEHTITTTTVNYNLNPTLLAKTIEDTPYDPIPCRHF